MKRYIKEGHLFNGYLEIDGKTVINPTEEELVQAGWQVIEENPTTDQQEDIVEEHREPTPEELLQTAIEQKIYDIRYYDSSDEINSFKVGSLKMWLDKQERCILYAALLAHEQLGKETMTKIYHGHTFTYPLAQWKKLLGLIEIYATDCLNTTETHIEAVKRLTNREEVLAYNYKTGYPEPLILG
ncbi:hypothetical protein [Prevotella fusca]|uniref:DUF4376 domain-containing protein n=1 Tax=Prevotella fusca JCM 17724 TaxID=1236517 RepID=A0ABX7Y0N5_9BACT|nr:hypothetical protein [Prevotella fusca]QUB87569.1 hypothetical protein J5A51_08990 [Prevotella fusca JCM 17724]